MAESTSGSSTLLWLRSDRSRDEGRAYWAGDHSQIVARQPGLREYRQHHFAAENPGRWPTRDGVETAIPLDRRIDGVPEVTNAHRFAPVVSLLSVRKVQQDEQHVFARTVLNLTGNGDGRWYKTGYGQKVGARAFVLLRRRGGQDAADRFKALVHDELGPALDRAVGVVELRTQAFRSHSAKLWNTPNVAHDYPEHERFHAAVIVGAVDAATLDAALETVNTELAASLTQRCAAIHAYDVEQTLACVIDGRPTLPQVARVRKPRLDPVRRTGIPVPPARAAEPASAVSFPTASLVSAGGQDPEDVIFDPDGHAIVGVSGGRILRVDLDTQGVQTLGDTGGRPLGLELEADGRIIVCDAYKGLLRLDPASGEIEELVRIVDDVPLRFCSNATAAADGTIWFTESTSRYDFEQFFGALLEHRASGRLFRRDPDGTVTVVLDGLHFANGVTLTADESALLFAETGAARISRYDIASGQVSVVADNLPGYPDNMSRLADGRFWVALTNPRDQALEKLAIAPALLRKLIWRIPDRLVPEGTRTTWVMAFDEHGRTQADFQEDREDFHMVTGVAEHEGRLALVSPQHSGILTVELPAEEG